MCIRATRLIHDIDAAIERLADRDDGEALHDIRVNLRRLRVWLQAFRAPLHIKPAQRRELKYLARRTNLARDAEVALAWWARLEHRATRGDFHSGLLLLRDEHYARLRQELPRAWQPLAAKLRRRISHARVHGSQKLYRETLAGTLKAYGLRLANALKDAAQTPDAARIHRLRISAKRIRYLLEMAGLTRPHAQYLLRELRALHTLAGRIHDLQRYIELSEEVFQRQASLRYRRLLRRYVDVRVDDRAVPRVAADTSVLPLLQSCRRAARRQSREMAEFANRYLGRRRPAYILHVNRLIARLDRSVTTA